VEILLIIEFNGTLNAYLNALENHNPNLPEDVHRWIPQGLCYDLIDPVGEPQPIDNVVGYTSEQCFIALQPDVTSVPLFRDRILQQNGNIQFINVNDLFFRYGY